MNRRELLRSTGVITAFGAPIFVGNQASANGIITTWPTMGMEIPGKVLNGGEINDLISAVENHKTLISLANDDFLRVECERIASSTAEAIQQLKTLQENYADNLTTTQITQAISIISAGVGAVSLSAAVAGSAFVTSPVWIGIGVGIGTINLLWSLVQFERSGTADRFVMGVSHVSGRLSLIGAADFVSDAAKFAGARLTALATLADLYTAISASASIKNLSNEIDNSKSQLVWLHNKYAAFDANLSECRNALVNEIELTIEGLYFIQSLDTLTLDGPKLILP